MPATYTHPGVKFVAYYPRHLSDLERDIVTGHGWHRLATVEPAPGQVCRHILIHPDWPSDDKIEAGFWIKNATAFIGQIFSTESYPIEASVTGFERGDGGIFVGDPQHTYWKAT